MAENSGMETEKKAKEQQKEKPKADEKDAAQGKIAVLEAEKKELVETLQRLQAEFENYKKRVEKEKQQCVLFGKAGIVSGLLAVLDSFDSAMEKMRKEKKPDAGMELLHRQLLQPMQKLGLREISALGKQFSHETMDCMMRGNDKKCEEGIVLEEFQKGYMLDGIVLRHAKVKVNKKGEEEKSTAEDGKKDPVVNK